MSEQNDLAEKIEEELMDLEDFDLNIISVDDFSNAMAEKNEEYKSTIDVSNPICCEVKSDSPTIHKFAMEEPTGKVLSGIPRDTLEKSRLTMTNSPEEFCLTATTSDTKPEDVQKRRPCPTSKIINEIASDPSSMEHFQNFIDVKRAKLQSHQNRSKSKMVSTFLTHQGRVGKTQDSSVSNVPSNSSYSTLHKIEQPAPRELPTRLLIRDELAELRDKVKPVPSTPQPPIIYQFWGQIRRKDPISPSKPQTVQPSVPVGAKVKSSASSRKRSRPTTRNIPRDVDAVICSFPLPEEPIQPVQAVQPPTPMNNGESHTSKEQEEEEQVPFVYTSQLGESLDYELGMPVFKDTLQIDLPRI